MRRRLLLGGTCDLSDMLGKGVEKKRGGSVPCEYELSFCCDHEDYADGDCCYDGDEFPARLLQMKEKRKNQHKSQRRRFTQRYPLTPRYIRGTYCRKPV